MAFPHSLRQRRPLALSSTLPPLSLLLFLFTFAPVRAVQFRDVTFESGLRQPGGPCVKYGGAVIADVDGDGRLDLLLTHHTGAVPELYFNNPTNANANGTVFNFSRARTPWRKGDYHAVMSAQLSPASLRHTIFFLQGGSNGNSPQPPLIFDVSASRVVRAVLRTKRYEAFERDGRGRLRSMQAMRLQARNKRPPYGAPDLLLTSVHLKTTRAHQRAFQFRSGQTSNNGTSPTYYYGADSDAAFVRAPLRGGYETQRNEFVTAADVDGDGIMEVIGFQSLKVHRPSWRDDFRLIDVTRRVLPRHMLGYVMSTGVAAIAEFDFDNDGRWDLYIARTTKQNLHWLPLQRNTNDVLLRNVGGRYVDVSRAANIPRGGLHRGVTAADFDNDGYVDLVVTRYDMPDILLRNRGDGTFEEPVVVGNKFRNVVGDMASAVDLDEDGRVDLVVSEGAWVRQQALLTGGGKKANGYYRLLKNITPQPESESHANTWLLVRVGNAPDDAVTSLHAVVVAAVTDPITRQRRRLFRRVGGSAAGVAVGISWVNTVHFGLGANVSVVDSVTVTWADRTVETLRNVKFNQKLEIGSFP